MNLLGNEIRFNILKLVHSEPRSFSDLMAFLSLESSSKLSFHLSKLASLIVKRDDGCYEVTEVGERAYLLITAFESGPPFLDEAEVVETQSIEPTDQRMLYDVFISKAPQDNLAAKSVYQVLEKNDFTCWMPPHDMNGAVDYFHSVSEALKSSRLMVLIFSSNADSSKQVKREIELALKNDLTVVPIKIENVMPSRELEKYLSTMSWVEAHSQPLATHLAELVDVVSAVLMAKRLYAMVDEKARASQSQMLILREKALAAPLPLGVRILETFAGFQSDDLVQLVPDIPLPLPIKKDENPKSWVEGFAESMEKFSKTKVLREWLHERCLKLSYGTRGLQDYGLVDALLAVPPLEQLFNSLRDCLLERGKTGLFARSGMGKSRCLLYTAHWWNKKFNSPIYFIEEPQFLTQNDWAELEGFLRNYQETTGKKSRILLIIEDFHLVPAKMLPTINKIISGAFPTSWSVILAYTEKSVAFDTDKTQKQAEDYFAMIQNIRKSLQPVEMSEILDFVKAWKISRTYFYEWIRWVAVNALGCPVPWERWSWEKKRILAQYDSPWAFVIAMGYLDSAINQLQKESEENIFPSLLYSLISQLYLINGEQDIEISQLVSILGATLKEELEELYMENWREEIVKLLVKWTEPEYRLLPPLVKKRIRGRLQQIIVLRPYHQEWARTVTEKVLFTEKSDVTELLQSIFETLVPEVFQFWQDLYCEEVLEKIQKIKKMYKERIRTLYKWLQDQPKSFLKWLQDYTRFEVSQTGKLQLRELDLFEHAPIREHPDHTLPESIGKLVTLKKLNLGLNYLESLPDSFIRLTNLTHLNLGFNPKLVLPENIGDLRSLQVLISRNYHETLPWSIGELKDLEILDISSDWWDDQVILTSGMLTSLPASIGKLSRLKILKASYNKLETIPNEIGNLKHLEELLLHSNKLTTLPDTIGSLSNLVYLDVSRNTLESLPANIGNLKNLEKLQLASTSTWTTGKGAAVITDDPLGSKYRHRNDNNLTNLPESIGQLENLKELLIHNNDLESLPTTIGSLRHLEILSLQSNALSELPESVKDLINLKRLHLGKNKISNLNSLEVLANLVNLRYLDLQLNNISAIPSSFDRLTKLEELVLKMNEIKTLPLNPSAFPKLKYLHIDKTMLDESSQEIVRKFEEKGSEVEELDIKKELFVALKKRKLLPSDES